MYLTAEPVDIPVTPVPFSLKNGNDFDGDWGEFREKLQNGDTRTVEDIVEQDNVSKRTAYRRTAEAKNQSKANRDIEICNRYNKLKQTQQEIADVLGIGLATVNRVLKEQPF